MSGRIHDFKNMGLWRRQGCNSAALYSRYFQETALLGTLCGREPVGSASFRHGKLVFSRLLVLSSAWLWKMLSFMTRSSKERRISKTWSKMPATRFFPRTWRIKFLTWNRAAEIILGYSKEEADRQTPCNSACRQRSVHDLAEIRAKVEGPAHFERSERRGAQEKKHGAAIIEVSLSVSRLSRR